jgi:hypothetical protein
VPIDPDVKDFSCSFTNFQSVIDWPEARRTE